MRGYNSVVSARVYLEAERVDGTAIWEHDDLFFHVNKYNRGERK